MAKFPHTAQVCLLFDTVKPLDLDAVVATIVEAEASVGAQYHNPERTPLFYRLFDGTNDVMLTIELVPNRAQDAIFEWALQSNYNRLLAPDTAERIKRHKSHVLIDVHHGVFPDLGEQMALLEQTGMLAGQTVQHFQHRLAIAERVAAHIINAAPVSLVHYAPPQVLVPGPVFAAIVTQSITPHMLQIHPHVYSGEKVPDGSYKYGMKTIGATHFIDREIHLAPSHVAWPESVDTVLAFIHTALLENGYIIPDGDTFGAQDYSSVYQVTHIPAGEKSDEFDGPLYRLDLLMHKETNFEAPAYVMPVRTFDDRNIPTDLKADIGRGLPVYEHRLRARRDMAEKVGASFNVRTNTVNPKDEPPAQRGLARWLPFLRGKGD